MTTPTSGAAIQRYKIGYHADEWGQRSRTPSGIPDASGSWVRYADHVTALAATAAVAGCTRSHPHENMDIACRAKAAIAEMRNKAARGAEATAQDLERFVSMLAAAPTTQPQAGAVPLPKFLALKFHARRDKKATVTLLFPGHEAADAWVRGIKGGQHGTE